MASEDTRLLVETFWQRMASNDFASVAPLLADDFLLEWPQSRERVRGAQAFVQMNTEYPAHGPWRFSIERIVAGTDEAVSEVRVSDGVQSALALTFFRFRDGRIAQLREFWPEPYPPPPGRAHLTEPMD